MAEPMSQQEYIAYGKTAFKLGYTGEQLERAMAALSDTGSSPAAQLAQKLKAAVLKTYPQFKMR